MLKRYKLLDYTTNLPLAHLERSDLGTLRHIFQFEFPTKVGCDFLVSIHNVEGGEGAFIPHLSITPERVEVEIIFGVLRGTLSLLPLDKNCGLAGKPIAKLINCREKNFTIGSPNRPIIIKALINRSPTFDPSIEVDLGMIDIDCLHFLPKSVKRHIADNMSIAVEKFLANYLSHVIGKMTM